MSTLTKYKYNLKNLDCANCALKIENKIRELENINNVSINFLTEKFLLDAKDEFFEEIRLTLMEKFDESEYAQDMQDFFDNEDYYD